MALGNNGYVSIYRKLQDSFLWGRSDWLAAWLDLLLTANWKDGQQTVAGQVVNVPRGSLVASERFLQERWAQWGFETRKAVRYLLSLMDREGMILRQKLGPRVTLITLCNYEAYQDPVAESGPRKAHERPTKGPKINKGIREEELQPPLVGLGADQPEPEEKKAKPSKRQPAEIPEPLLAAIPDFAERWATRMKNAGRKKPGEDAELDQLAVLEKALKEHGKEVVLEAVDAATLGGYQGIFVKPRRVAAPRAHGWHPNPAEDFQ